MPEANPVSSLYRPERGTPTGRRLDEAEPAMNSATDSG